MQQLNRNKLRILAKNLLQDTGINLFSEEIISVFHTGSHARGKQKTFSDIDFEIITNGVFSGEECVNIEYINGVPKLIYGYIVSLNELIEDINDNYGLALWYKACFRDAKKIYGNDIRGLLNDNIKTVLKDEKKLFKYLSLQYRKILEYTQKFANHLGDNDTINIHYILNAIFNAYCNIYYASHGIPIESENSYYESVFGHNAIDLQGIYDTNNIMKVCDTIKLIFGNAESWIVSIQGNNSNSIINHVHYNELKNRVLSYLETTAKIRGGLINNNTLFITNNELLESQIDFLNNGGILFLKNIINHDDRENILEKINQLTISRRFSFGGEQQELVGGFYTGFDDEFCLSNKKLKEYKKNVIRDTHLINQYFGNIINTIRVVIADVTGVNTIVVRNGFTPFGIQKFPVGKHVSIKGGMPHFDLEGAFEGDIDLLKSIEINPENVKREIYTIVIMLNKPDEGGATLFWPKKFNPMIYDESKDFQIPVTKINHENGCAIVFSGFTFHGIESFSGSTDRITIVSHFRLNENGSIEHRF